MAVKKKLQSGHRNTPTKPKPPFIVIPPSPDVPSRPASGRPKTAPDHSPSISPPLSQGLKANGLELLAAGGMSKDVIAMAEFFATMKHTLSNLSDTFDRLETQTETMVSLGVDIKANEQLREIRSTLAEQIARQTKELEDVRNDLKVKVKEALTERLKAEAYAMIQDSVSKVIEERVRQELAIQISENLRPEVIGHRRHILEVKTDLHNTEARRYNASLQSPSLTVPLRPLLRPLPTPEQSPMPMLRTASGGSAVSPMPFTSFPKPQAPSMTRSVSAGNSTKSSPGFAKAPASALIRTISSGGSTINSPALPKAPPATIAGNYLTGGSLGYSLNSPALPKAPPSVIITTTSPGGSTNNSPMPFSANPRAPAATPTRTTLRTGPTIHTVPPTPSPLFPRDLRSLFALGPDAARSLLRDYGLDSPMLSPIKEVREAKPRTPLKNKMSDSAVTSPKSDEDSEEEATSHAQDMNKFMAHIGVPFLMVPAPKSQTQKGTSSGERRRRMLKPLIINSGPDLL